MKPVKSNKSIVEELKENAQNAAMKHAMKQAEKDKKAATTADSAAKKFPEEKIISINKEEVDAPAEQPKTAGR